LEECETVVDMLCSGMYGMAFGGVRTDDAVAVEDENNSKYHEHQMETIAQYCFGGRHRKQAEADYIIAPWQVALTRTVAHRTGDLTFNDHCTYVAHGCFEEPINPDA
jgi:hypothetical protein